jgi:acetylornithine deacetylase/succinyl-diaminopimelate desuccinylase-like protein
MSATDLLRELLRTDTTNPPGNEGPAIELLEARLGSAELEVRVLRDPDGRPNLVARVPGPRDRAALVLLSHVDVVAVEHEQWTRAPFGGDLGDGAIWGRGALDMKGIAVMHAEAAAALARSDAGVNREVIVCAVADEEAGGEHGAGWLTAEHPEAVGFEDGRPPPEVLGEGAFGLTGVLDRPVMPVALGEKTALWLDVRARGEPGHGSLPPSNQAAVQLAAFVAEASGHGPARVHPVMREQFRILAAESRGARAGIFRALASGGGQAIVKALAPALRKRGALGSLISDTITPTVIDAGHKHNVVPSVAGASFDCRLLPDTDPDAFTSRLQKLATKHAASVDVKAHHGGPVSKPGRLFHILEEASSRLPGHPIVVPTLTPGITDIRYFRSRGAIGYGWVPLVLSSELLATIHGNDERVPEADFERAVRTMTHCVRRAAA